MMLMFSPLTRNCNAVVDDGAHLLTVFANVLALMHKFSIHYDDSMNHLKIIAAVGEFWHKL